MKLCRHCNNAPVNRPRGLCWACHRKHRDLYPITGKYARKGLVFGNTVPPLPEPTEAPPGSLEKVEALVKRAENNQQLWHPDDAKNPVPKRDGERVPSEENAAMLARRRAGATIAELAQEFGLNRNAVDKRLRRLKVKGAA